MFTTTIPDISSPEAQPERLYTIPPAPADIQTLVAVRAENGSCDGCYFLGTKGVGCYIPGENTQQYPCTSAQRRDGQSVIWVRG